MIPTPTSVWMADGWMSHDAPTQKVIEQAVAAGSHARLVGFVFAGPGWYPQHRVLVTPTYETKNGAETFHLRFYRTDPREEFYLLSRLPKIEEIP